MTRYSLVGDSMCKKYRILSLFITLLILIISGCGYDISNSEGATSVVLSTESGNPDVG